MSLKWASFDRLCVVSYYCSLVILSIKRTVFDIFDFKTAVTLKNRLRSVRVIGNVTMR